MLITAATILTGCGSGLNSSLTNAASGQTPAPNPTPLHVSGNVTNFGDSITYGVGASTPGKNYASLLDAYLAPPSAKNFGVSGDEAADMARNQVYPNANPKAGTNPIYTVLIGTNNIYFCGNTAACMANYTRPLAASLAWLALPDTDKVLGTAYISRQGNWTTDMGFGVTSNQPAWSLTYKVHQSVAQRPLLIAYRAFDATAQAGGTAVVQIDGGKSITLSGNTDVGMPILTHNGASDTVFLASLPMGAVGDHTVTVATSGQPGGVFSLLWMGNASTNYTAGTGGPRVAIGYVTDINNANYTAAVDAYNSALTTLVYSMAQQGMDVELAPTYDLLQTSQFWDSLHPNDSGHAALAQAFESLFQ